MLEWHKPHKDFNGFRAHVEGDVPGVWTTLERPTFDGVDIHFVPHSNLDQRYILGFAYNHDVARDFIQSLLGATIDHPSATDILGQTDVRNGGYDIDITSEGAKRPKGSISIGIHRTIISVNYLPRRGAMLYPLINFRKIARGDGHHWSYPLSDDVVNGVTARFVLENLSERVRATRF